MPTHKRVIEPNIYETLSGKFACQVVRDNKHVHRTFNTLDEAQAFKAGNIPTPAPKIPIKAKPRVKPERKVKPQISEIKIQNPEKKKESTCVVIIAKDAGSIKTILQDMEF